MGRLRATLCMCDELDVLACWRDAQMQGASMTMPPRTLYFAKREGSPVCGLWIVHGVCILDGAAQHWDTSSSEPCLMLKCGLWFTVLKCGLWFTVGESVCVLLPYLVPVTCAAPS